MRRVYVGTGEGTPRVPRGEATRRGGHSSRYRPDFVLLLSNKIRGQGGDCRAVLCSVALQLRAPVPCRPLFYGLPVYSVVPITIGCF